MNTWKNNNVLTRLKESYFVADTDRGEVSESLSDARPVGGTIFYIDETADGKYEFFDIDGNPIENVRWYSVCSSEWSSADSVSMISVAYPHSTSTR